MKKYRKGIIATLGIVLGIIALNVIISTTTGFNVLSNTINNITNKKSPNEVKSISLTTDDYDDNKGGSYKVDKSAEWTGTDTTKIDFNVDTRMKTSDSYKDVILVLDISGSMYGDKLNKVKSDAKELTESLLSNQENRVALITFESTSKVEYELTNNKEELLSKIDGLTDRGCTNYNQALINVDKILEGYEKKDNRDLVVLFLTDGYPNEETPNQVSQYKMLKEKYPYITINGIQYEMGKNIIEEIKNISDNQYIASMDTLNNILFEASLAPEFYEKFELVDYIDDDYFYVESVDDIKVSIGKVELTEENGVQKVIWSSEPNEFRTGSKANMTINLKLKEQYVGNEGYYSTNKKFEVTTKLSAEKEVTKETDKTPILKSGYKVIYDINTPTGCNLDNFEEAHYAFENVKISDKELTCEGYQFKGWEVVDNVKKVNDDYFIMPSNDVTIKAIWSKQSITKSMDGTVYVVPSIMKKYEANSTDDYHDYKYRSKVTKIVIKDNTDVPKTAIESWDVSQEGNESVIAYIEDDGTGIGTYKVTIGGKGKVFANEDSSYLFYNFSNLKEIDLSNFDTSKVTNMSHMFLYCRSLTSLDLSNFDTRQVTNMSYMFYECSKLTSLDLSSFDTSKVTDMREMFDYCISLITLDLSNFDTSKVTNMRLMFSRCSSLTTLDLSNFDTSNVTDMAEMFSRCSSLTTLDLSSFDTSQVTNMWAMFYECSKLTSLDVSSFDTSKVTSMSSMFYNCSSLTSLDVSNFDTSKVTSMSSMFYKCNKLTSLDVSNFDTSNVTNMSSMFSGCSFLTNLNISNFDTSKVIDMSNMFNGCCRLISLDLSNFDTSRFTRMFRMFYDCSSLTTTINIKGKPSSYNEMFKGAATNSGAMITINYTSDNSSLVDALIATKSVDSNIIKGSLITN